MTLPGARLKRWAARFCSPQTMERLVNPIVSDLQTEYRDPPARAGWRRRLGVWSGYAAFWKALALHAILECVGSGADAERTPLNRVLAYSSLAFVCFTLMLVFPPLLGGIRWDLAAADQLILALLLVPQALPLSIPAGICVGVLAAMRARRLTPHHVVSVLMIALVATAAAWVLLEWGVPSGNQRFRELVWAQPGDGRVYHLERGLAELRLSTLALRQDAEAVRLYHVRLALCLATVPLSVFVLGLAPRLRRLGPALLAGVFAPLGYFSVIWALADLGPAHLTMVVLGAWMPNALFLAIGCTLLHRERRAA